MQPTYSFTEAIERILNSDKEGLELLMDLFLEEIKGYSNKDIKTLLSIIGLKRLQLEIFS